MIQRFYWRQHIAMIDPQGAEVEKVGPQAIGKPVFEIATIFTCLGYGLSGLDDDEFWFLHRGRFGRLLVENAGKRYRRNSIRTQNLSVCTCISPAPA